MKIGTYVRAGLLMVIAASVIQAAGEGRVATLKGYVLDSACAFTKNLAKPISRECAISCARAGSPLVILAEDGAIFWPISDTTPAAGQNDKLLPFAGERVKVTGRVFTRGGSHAIVIAKIEPAAKQ